MRNFIFCFLLYCTSCAGVAVIPKILQGHYYNYTFSIKDFEVRSNNLPANFNGDFTDKLIIYIQSRTKLKYQKEEGDIEYQGSITKYEVTPIGANRNGIAQLQRLTVTIEIGYYNIHQKEPLELEFTHFVDFDKSELLSEVEPRVIDQLQEEFFVDILNETLYDW